MPYLSAIDSTFCDRFGAIVVLPLLLLLPACATQTGLTSSELVTADPRVATTIPTVADVQAAGVERLGQTQSSQNSVRPAVLTLDPEAKPAKSTIVPLSHEVITETGGQPPVCCPGAVFTPAEPRMDLAQGHHSWADLYPDEFLADGGDRKAPVHYFSGQRRGLETEDTIAEYKDHFNEPHLRASNRVVVYSPRFGSVEVVEGAGTDVQVNQVVRSVDVAGTSIMNRQEGLHQNVAEDGMLAFDSRRRADGAETRVTQLQSEFTTESHEQNKADQSVQALSSRNLQTFERWLGIQFHDSLTNASLWTRDLYPVLSASTAQATQVKARFSPQDFTGIEDQRAAKSEIHIVKLADRETAEAGDTIHFTIRFINTGDYDLHDIRIVDNLTPRLQFITDSAATDRPGEVTTEPNGEGSDILTFALDGILPAHESGTIEFDVRVR